MVSPSFPSSAGEMYGASSIYFDRRKAVKSQAVKVVSYHQNSRIGSLRSASKVKTND